MLHKMFYWAASMKAIMTPTATDVTVAWSVPLSVCPPLCMSSIPLVHPAKAVGRNKMPFSKNTVLDGGSAGLTMAQVAHLREGL